LINVCRITQHHITEEGFIYIETETEFKKTKTQRQRQVLMERAVQLSAFKSHYVIALNETQW
jgi:hypothetical protein